MKKILCSCILALTLMGCGFVQVWGSETEEMVSQGETVESEQDVGDEAASEEPTANEPVTDEPTADEPTVDEPKTEEPAEELTEEEETIATPGAEMMEEVPEVIEENEAGQAQAGYSGWYQAYGNHYYFVDGKRAIGWWIIDGNSYYFKKTGDNITLGKMLKGWQSIGGRVFYFKKTGSAGDIGRVLTGWRELGGNMFYLKKTGNLGTKGMLLTGWQTIGGKTFYFKKSGSLGTKGKMLTAWQTIGGRKFFFNTNEGVGTRGSMLIGWWRINGDIYFFKRSGENGIKGCMFTGWQTIDGKTYRFASNGKKIDTVEVDDYLAKSASYLAKKIPGVKKDNRVSFPYYTLSESSGIIQFASSGIAGYSDHISTFYTNRSANITFCNMYIGQNFDNSRPLLNALGWSLQSSSYSGGQWSYVFYRPGVEDEYLGVIVSGSTNKVKEYEYSFYEEI